MFLPRPLERQPRRGSRQTHEHVGDTEPIECRERRKTPWRTCPRRERDVGKIGLDAPLPVP